MMVFSAGLQKTVELEKLLHMSGTSVFVEMSGDTPRMDWVKYLYSPYPIESLCIPSPNPLRSGSVLGLDKNTLAFG
jgi:hypothetical protein